MLRALHGQLGAAQRMAGAGPPAGAGWEPNLTGDAVSLGGLRETLGAGLGLPGGVQPEADLAGAAAQPGDMEREAGAGAHDVPDPDPAAAPGAARERAWQEERDVRVLELLRSKARARQRCRDPLGHAPGCAMAAALGRRDATRKPRAREPWRRHTRSRLRAARSSKPSTGADVCGRGARAGRRGTLRRASESMMPKYVCRDAQILLMLSMP